MPWFLQDLGTYGIGIFTPTILAAALGGASDHIRSLSDLISNDILAAKGAAMITVAADRRHRLCRRRWPTSSAGSSCRSSASSAARLVWCIASFSIDFSRRRLRSSLIFVGFMLFNFMTNLGPNAQTYLLAGEVFPTAGPRHGRRLRRGLRQDRRGDDGVPVPDPAGRDRHAVPALRIGRHLAARRSRDVDLPDRDDRRCNLDRIGRR